MSRSAQLAALAIGALSLVPSYAAFSGTHNKTGTNEVSIDGNAPTEDNVKLGKYPFGSSEHISPATSW